MSIRTIVYYRMNEQCVGVCFVTERTSSEMKNINNSQREFTGIVCSCPCCVFDESGGRIENCATHNYLNVEHHAVVTQQSSHPPVFHSTTAVVPSVPVVQSKLCCILGALCILIPANPQRTPFEIRQSVNDPRHRTNDPPTYTIGCLRQNVLLLLCCSCPSSNGTFDL